MVLGYVLSTVRVWMDKRTGAHYPCLVWTPQTIETWRKATPDAEQRRAWKQLIVAVPYLGIVTGNIER